MPSSKLLADVISDWGACADRCMGEGRESAAEKRKTAREVGRENLAQTIEGEVIPRLMLAHSNIQSGRLWQNKEHGEPTLEDVTELTRLILEHDVSVALKYVTTLKDSGMSAESLYLRLIAPSARLFGEMWKADICDFSDVTVALSRLQHLLHELSPAYGEEPLPQMNDRKVLLLPLPGEQHTFGVMMVEEFFRRSGWECCTAMPQSPKEVSTILKRDKFDVVGVSVSCEVYLDRVGPVLEMIRKSSKNKAVTVLVGGQLFLDHPEYVSRVGADGTAADGREAVLRLRSLFDTRARQDRITT